MCIRDRENTALLRWLQDGKDGGCCCCCGRPKPEVQRTVAGVQSLGQPFKTNMHGLTIQTVEGDDVYLLVETVEQQTAWLTSLREIATAHNFFGAGFPDDSVRSLAEMGCRTVPRTIIAEARAALVC